MSVHEFVAEARGVGRADYSAAIEMTTEPVVTSWQGVYAYHERVEPPLAANSSRVIDVPIEAENVVLLYDFFASIPANRLIKLDVDSIDAEGNVAPVVRQSAYQTVAVHASRGAEFQSIIRFTVYNYAPFEEENMRIGCAGIITTMEEFRVHLIPYETPT